MTIEANYLPAACRTCLRLQPTSKAARTKYQETFMQGVLSAAVAAGWMTLDRANQIDLLCACGRCGRLEEFIEQQAAMAKAQI
jgi:hypothetical protein